MVFTRVVFDTSVPPKNWEARSWSGEGRRPSGHSTRLGSPHSIELALDSIELCLELLSFFLKPAPVRLSQENHRNKSRGWILKRSDDLLCGGHS
ncbi:unnamed protein product [Microthlaspi erraticum]|uniref:Uncharacterized protein n=1 Tax=Microthlaspi erraticum TaxID=1685480 RepID=A0A6D2HS02_9BRAS|nr:unnamed protein product [Microthlaspi erraticum]